MLGIKVAFWFAVSLLFYVYLGYLLLLSAIALLRKKTTKTQELCEPVVSLIIAAYNEEAVIGDKIENSLQLDYPKDKLEIIVFSDASTDRTDEIVKRGEILVFSDANSMYEPDAIRKLVHRFADERVGCVSGELRYRSGKGSVEGERTYWKYEQIVKRLESRLSSVVGVNGSVYAIRQKLFEPLPSDVLEDFVRPLRLVQKGHRVIYEPSAVNWETTAPNPSREFQRRVRIVTQSVYSLFRDKALRALLNPFRYGIFSVQLWSHKVLRWLSGFFLLLIFALNIPLLGQGTVYTITMAGQGAFYLLALWGFISEVVLNRRAPKLPHIAYYFCLSCYAMLKGVYNGLRGRTIVTWQPRGM